MSNSSLVSYTRLSPHYNPRNHAIDTVSIHCVVGQMTAKQILNMDRFDLEDADDDDASCNYAIGYDGSIGLCVEEKNRSWCTSSRENDHRAITIEVASSTKHPYTVTAAAYEALINLLVDICKRNPGIGTLKWKADKSLIGHPEKQNMTVHRWFAPKTCPGEYLYSRHAQIAAEVNARLNSSTGSGSSSGSTSFKAEIEQGDTVSICNNATYYNGVDVPTWVIRKKWIVKKVVGDRVVIDKSTDGKNAINSVINAKYLTVVKKKSDLPYMVHVTIDDLNIRKGPGINYAKTGKFTGVGIFTITEVKSGKGSKAGWGKLKSSTTAEPKWISLDYAKRVK